MVCVNDELGKEAFTYTLASGKEDTVHVEQVLDYNRDPRYMRNLLLYKLTLIARGAGGEVRPEQAGVDPPPGHVARPTLSPLGSEEFDEIDRPDVGPARRVGMRRGFDRAEEPRTATVSQAGRRAKVPSPSGRGLG